VWLVTFEEDSVRVFSDGEMQRRIEKLRRMMDEQGVDAILASSYPAFYYLSGAPVHPFGRPMVVMIPREGDAAIIQSIIELDHTRDQSWIDDIRTYWDYNILADYEDPRPPTDSMVELLVEFIRERSLERCRIGIEDATLPSAQHRMIHRALPGATLVGMSDPLARQRMVLSVEELELIRAADAIADVGQAEMISRIQPGKSARELWVEVREAMLAAILADHPDKPFHMHIGTGIGDPSKSAGHSEWTTWNGQSRVEPGHLLETVLSVWLWGYWGNVERAVWVGPLTDEVQRSFEVMIEANEAAIEAVRPGVPLADVDRAAKEILKKYGYTTRSGSGCGRGIVSYEANARELLMDVRLYSDVILEPGMAFSLEPDVLVPSIGTFRHCNTIIVTAGGCEVDSKLPRGIVTAG
jgi:Xaa-Pro dipeptidase